MLYTLFHKTDEGVLKRYFTEEKKLALFGLVGII